MKFEIRLTRDRYLRGQPPSRNDVFRSSDKYHVGDWCVHGLLMEFDMPEDVAELWLVFSTRKPRHAHYFEVSQQDHWSLADYWSVAADDPTQARRTDWTSALDERLTVEAYGRTVYAWMEYEEPRP